MNALAALLESINPFYFPWEALNGGNDEQILLAPPVSPDIVAKNRGGNVYLDLSGMSIIRLMTEMGGGNVEVILMCNRQDYRNLQNISTDWPMQLDSSRTRIISLNMRTITRSATLKSGERKGENGE